MVASRSKTKEVRSKRVSAASSVPIVEPSSTGTATVSVGCKLPNGIHMDFAQPGKPLQRFTLRGSNSARVIGGYGITENVPKNYFDRWMEQNKHHPAVENSLIFAMPNTASLKAKALEHRELQHGFEPVNPKKPLTATIDGTKVSVEALGADDGDMSQTMSRLG